MSAENSKPVTKLQTRVENSSSKQLTSNYCLFLDGPQKTFSVVTQQAVLTRFRATCQHL